MSRDASHNANLEGLIAEMRAAEEAGVFARSRVDVSMLAGRPAVSKLVRFYEWALVGLPLAACLAIVVGLVAVNGGPLPTAVTPSPVAQMDAATVDAAAEPCGAGMLATCLSGPGASTTEECSCVDFDQDGDVDMLDMSSYQRMVASLN